jgi:glutamine amidotransferase PdxT
MRRKEHTFESVAHRFDAVVCPGGEGTAVFHFLENGCFTSVERQCLPSLPSIRVRTMKNEE